MTVTVSKSFKMEESLWQITVLLTASSHKGSETFINTFPYECIQVKAGFSSGGYSNYEESFHWVEVLFYFIIVIQLNNKRKSLLKFKEEKHGVRWEYR